MTALHGNRQIDVAIAIILRDARQRTGLAATHPSNLSASQVLICQRKANNTFGGYWEFPGGKREPDETLEQCLARELEEEVAIRAEPIEAFDPIETVRGSLCLRLHPFLCRHLAGEPRPIECQRAIWVDPPRLRDHRFPPANGPLIDRILQRLTGRSPRRP